MVEKTMYRAKELHEKITRYKEDISTLESYCKPFFGATYIRNKGVLGEIYIGVDEIKLIIESFKKKLAAAEKEFERL